MKLRTVFICLSIPLLASCDPEEKGIDFDPDDRRITEIVGVCEEVYDGTSYRQSSRHRFVYDDRGRLDRWIYTTASTYDGEETTDIQISYESDTQIGITGSYVYDGGAKAIVAQIDLDPTGRIVRIDLGDETRSYRYANGWLSQSVGPYGTTDYAWTDGDLTEIRYVLSSSGETGSEFCSYGDVPNIAALDLNYLAYATEWFSLPIDWIGPIVGAIGLFGRNTHLVVANGSDDRFCAIRWRFDERGYPTGWITEHATYRYRNTIYYND